MKTNYGTEPVWYACWVTENGERIHWEPTNALAEDFAAEMQAFVDALENLPPDEQWKIPYMFCGPRG